MPKKKKQCVKSMGKKKLRRGREHADITLTLGYRENVQVSSRGQRSRKHARIKNGERHSRRHRKKKKTDRHSAEKGRRKNKYKWSYAASALECRTRGRTRPFATMAARKRESTTQAKKRGADWRTTLD